MILRATAFGFDECIPHQIDNSSDTVASLSIAMADTLDKLEDECTMPNFRTVQSWTRKQTESRARENIIGLYKEQAIRDYQLLRSKKERNVMLAHLEQAIPRKP